MRSTKTSAKHATLAALVAAALSTTMLVGCGAASSSSSSAVQNDAPSAQESSPASTQAGAAAYSEETNDIGTSSSAQPSFANFSAKTADGASFTQADIAKADLTVINIWSLNCGPCLNEMPELAEWAKMLPENIQVVTACLDYDWEPSFAKEVLDGAGFTGVTLVSGDSNYEQLVYSYMYTPTTIVVDSTGALVGEPLVGSPRNFAKTYNELVNNALTSLGKDTIDAAA